MGTDPLSVGLERNPPIAKAEKETPALGKKIVTTSSSTML